MHLISFNVCCGINLLWFHKYLAVSVCGRNVCFWKESTRRNWDNSKIACESKGGMFAKILSAEENELVESIR